MEQKNIVELIKFLRENYEKAREEFYINRSDKSDKRPKEWVEWKENLKNNIFPELFKEIYVNFEGLGIPPHIYTLHILYKNRSDELYYTNIRRKEGYYVIITDIDKTKVGTKIDTGIDGLKEWYGEETQSQCYNELKEIPYKLAIKKHKEVIEKYKTALEKLKKEEVSLEYINENFKDQYFNNIEELEKYVDEITLKWINEDSAEYYIEKIEDIEKYTKELQEIIKYYPEVMKEYMNDNKEISQKYENVFKEKGGHNIGKTFTVFIWTYMEKEYNKEPIIKQKNNSNDGDEENEEMEEVEEAIKEINEESSPRNLIVYGVPGSGKSYYIKNTKLRGVSENNIERITFYPEYTYYDFVGQRLPAKDGTGLIFEEGPFTRILKKAICDQEQKPYYLIIEEMNRGNAEAIFGDIFQLLDRNENGESEYKISNKLLEEELGIEKIYLPSNLYILATINNADQNVFNFDTAFGRRWEYELIACDEINDRSENQIYELGRIKGTDEKWRDVRKKINEVILNNKDEIYNAEEKRIGLYYIDKECLTREERSEEADESEYAKKFANKIFRYLYLSVFKNNQDKMFKKSNDKTLEDYIAEFKKANKKISDILQIGDTSDE